MKINLTKAWYMEYVLIVIGTGLMALSINSAFDPSGLVTGGFSGVAIVVKAWTEKLFDGGVPLWITNFGLNIPLFLIGARLRGFSFVKKAFIGELSLSFWLAVQPVWNIAENDLLIAAVYGGVIQGVGIGMVFLGRGTTGGSDMIAALIQRRFPHYSVSQVLQLIDGAVVLLGICVFGIHRALYAIIAVFLVTKISDGIIEGLKFSKVAYIITEKPREVSDMIMKELERGVTGIYARGMYAEKEKLMLFCVVNKKEIVLLKERVDAIDPEAFVIVGDAREVHGEGFIEKK